MVGGVTIMKRLFLIAGALFLLAMAATGTVAATTNLSNTGKNPPTAKLPTGPSLDTPTATPTCIAAWSVVTSPTVGFSESALFGADAVSADDVWAVGYYLTGT